MTEQLPAGLAGVVVADTEVGGVEGDAGFFHYREYDAVELARTRTLEEVWHLLVAGTLPDPTRLATFTQEVAAARHLSSDLCAMVSQIARAGPLDAPALPAVRTGLSLIAQAEGMQSWLGSHRGPADAFRLAGVLSTVVATVARAQAGETPVGPRDDLPTAENLLWMLDGQLPATGRARALEQYLILTVDHGFNASTFAARVIASTGADLGAAIVGGIGALSGPLHGGAPSRVIDMLNDIGDVDNARSWARGRLAQGEVIMGFGHRVYRTEDPRSRLLREIAQSLGGPFVELAVGVEPILREELRRHRPDRDIRTNVEYFAGVVLHELGIAASLYPALFAVSRSIGWSAHIAEQIAANRIIRPAARYVGPAAPAPLPVPLTQSAGR